MIPLETLFERFCKCMDGKLRWSGKDADWTAIVREFLKSEAGSQTPPLGFKEEHLRIDFIWRRPRESLVSQIELAVEHENVTRELKDLFDSELQHLLDIKAVNKVGIFYVNEGDESPFVEGVEKRIRAQHLRFPHEQYLIIVGRTTRREGRLAIRYKGYFFDAQGHITRRAEHVIAQAA